MQPKEVDGSLLRLYVESRCNAEQLAIIGQYLKDPAYQESLEKWLQSGWNEVLATDIEEISSPEQYQQFLSVIHSRKLIAETNPTLDVVRMPARKWWRIAAAAIIVVLMGLAGQQWLDRNKANQLAARDQQWVLMQNEPGKRTRIVLPDSSVVYLGGAARLQYNKNFGNTNRDLVLEGEAYFIVQHSTQPPFSVKTGDITTVDIGTAFNIRHHPAEQTIQVAVAEGAVNVIDQASAESPSSTSLHQLQQLSYDKITHQSIIQLLPSSAAIGGWREGVLAFRKQPFRLVAADLERFYGVTIHFAKPETAGLEITTTISHATMQQAMDIITLTAGVRWKKSGNVITIQ